MGKTISAKVDLNMYKKVTDIAKANNLTVSFLIKQALNNIKVKDKTLEIKKLKELNRIGNNLNQITKKINTNNFIDSKVLKEIKEIRRLLNDL